MNFSELDALITQWRKQMGDAQDYASQAVIACADELEAVLLRLRQEPNSLTRVDTMRARVWRYMSEDEREFAVDIMEDFLKMLGSTLPHKESDLTRVDKGIGSPSTGSTAPTDGADS